MEIPFAKACIGKEEENAVCEVLRSGWLTQGKVVAEFEERFADYVGAKYAISVNSATSALFLSLQYWKEKMNDLFGVDGYKKFLFSVPSFTFSATASVLKHSGIDFRFSDIDLGSYCMPSARTDCQIIVHLMGNKASIDNSNLGCIYTLEDSAHRILRNTQGKNPVCYSFYATKNMTTGEGGMITTNDEEMAKWLRKARLHGLNKDGFSRYANKGSWEYDVEFCGWKMNMTDIAASIGLVQLTKLDFMNQERKRCIDRYNQNLGLSNHGLHLYPILVNDRSFFIHNMLSNGVHCSVHFLPLHKMKAYKNIPFFFCDKNDVTEYIGDRIVSLPLYPLLKDEEIDYISELVLKSGLMIKDKYVDYQRVMDEKEK